MTVSSLSIPVTIFQDPELSIVDKGIYCELFWQDSPQTLKQLSKQINDEFLLLRSLTNLVLLGYVCIISKNGENTYAIEL